MRVEEHVEVLQRDGVKLADTAQRAGLDAAVPTCPPWQVRDLLRHLGGVHRWAAAHVTTRRDQPFTAEEQQQFFTSPGDDALIDWFRTGHQDLVHSLSTADPTVTCWTFLSAPSPLAFWARRQAHETAIHRADAESAVATVPEWEPQFAVDGIDELLSGFFARRPDRITADPPVGIALCATDIDTAWTIRIEPAGLYVDEGERQATLTLTGLASDLYLLLWNRTAADRLAVRGDLSAMNVWRSSATVRWS